MLALALVREHGHEQALTGQQALAGAEQRVHHAARPLLAAVAEDRLHRDALRHVHHRAGFGDGAFARIELDLDELHLVAVDLEVDVVRAAARRRRRRESAGAPAEAPRLDVRRERGHILHLLPLRHAGGEHQRLGIDAAVLQVGDDLLLADRSHLMATDGHVPLVRAVHCVQSSVSSQQ